MTIDLRRYEKLRRQADTLKSEVDQAKGAIKQLMERLEQEFDCSTIAEARKLLAELSKQETSTIEEYQSALADFEDELGDRLE